MRHKYVTAIRDAQKKTTAYPQVEKLLVGDVQVGSLFFDKGYEYKITEIKTHINFSSTIIAYYVLRTKLEPLDNFLKKL